MREDGQRESLRRRRARRRRRGPTHAHTSGRVCFERGEKKTWKKTCGIQNPEKAPELFLPPRLSAVGCDVSAGRRARTHPLRVPRRLSVSAIVSVTSLLRVATGCSGKGLAASSQGGFYTPATDRAKTATGGNPGEAGRRSPRRRARRSVGHDAADISCRYQITPGRKRKEKKSWTGRHVMDGLQLNSSLLSTDLFY